jgi:hypothetical protein
MSISAISSAVPTPLTQAVAPPPPPPTGNGGDTNNSASTVKASTQPGVGGNLDITA